MDMIGGIPLQNFRQPQMGAPAAGGGRPRRPTGPVAGLQAARSYARPMGGQTPNAYQAQHVANTNQNIQNRMNPFLNSQGGMTYATGNLNPMGQTGTGQNIYGWGPDGPNLNPQVDYVQFGPGEGPGMPAPRAQPQQQQQPTGPMGGLIAELPPLSPIADVGPIEDAEATREAYARAKDTAGQQGRAALDALMDIQGARGIVGSGIGVNEAGGVIGEAARQLGDFNREQAIQRVENERWRQGLNYQGRISQRGQDLGRQAQELERRRYNAGNSPYGHIQGAGVNPIPGWPRY